MDPLWVVAAFLFGAASSRIGLPPLVGYLVAGFVLNNLGFEGGQTLEKIADIGVTLLLFTIGLKLKLKSLSNPAVWGGTTLHMLITVCTFSAALGLIGASSATLLHLSGWGAAFLVAFALSFSSTVFAVKVFEQSREMGSRHAAIAIGILIMQDLIAVVFLTISAGQVPSPWALLLAISLLMARPLLALLINRCGHGELLMLFGIAMTAIGYGSFELVGLKGDLGALVFGVLLSTHPKAKELADRLLGFKDLFLVGFFLNIGMTGSLTLSGSVIALVLAVVMPFKAFLFFGILTRFKLRARTSLLAALSLANYSEFGLIVGSIGVSAGWLSGDWLVVIAVALSATFILAAPLNSAANTIYARLSSRLRRFETRDRLPEDQPIRTGDSEVAIIGMGGLGSSAFEEIRRRLGNVVIGVDFANETVEKHRRSGRNVIYGDAGDSDFWERFEWTQNRLNLIMLALPDPKTSIFALRRLRQMGFGGHITASVRYEDEIALLEEEGIDAAYSLYEEAGVGFADHVCDRTGLCSLADPGNLPTH
jgi:predicted Kef-type K+ transport protein